MHSAAILRKQFDLWRLYRPIELRPTLTEVGLTLGAGTHLMRVDEDPVAGPRFALEADGARLYALLAVAFDRPFSPGTLQHLESALNCWQRADKALANIHLAFARLPSLENENDAWRLYLAAGMLDHGLSPRRLLQELGYPPPSIGFTKFDPDQPRVPAGSGRNSGQWTSGDAYRETDGAVTTSVDTQANSTLGSQPNARDVAPSAVRAASSLLDELSADSLAALEVFATRFTFATAVLCALLIPSPESGTINEGTLRGENNIFYRIDDDTGSLELSASGDNGKNISVRAQLQDGLYVDLASGKSIGRNLNGTALIDLDAALEALADAGARSQEKNDEPKLCPAPEPDRPHGSSDQAKDYEEDVHARVNPLNPLPRGFAVKLWNPVQGQYVFFDDCFQNHGDLVDGDMQKGDLAEAKGERYSYFLSQAFSQGNVVDDLLRQAQLQTEAADASGRRIKWYFAEEWAANKVREVLSREYPDITVAYMPSRRRRRK